MPTNPPPITKTWMFNVNNLNATQNVALNDTQSLLWNIKQALSGFNPNAWVVTASCDASTAGFDRRDRWSSSSSLVWQEQGTAHSWIVLAQSGVLPNFQVCLDLNNKAANSQNKMSIIVSAVSGFRGGSTLYRPSASDEVYVRDGSTSGAMAWNGGFTTPYSTYYHVMMSSDGASTRVVCNSGGIEQVFWGFEAPVSPVSGWPTPWIAWAESQTTITTPCMDYATLLGPQSLVHCVRGKSNITFSASFSTEGSNTAPVGFIFPQSNEIDGNWPITPVGVLTTQAGVRGRHCTIGDMWFGSVGVQDGMTYPDDTSRAYVQFGVVIFPWNGTKARCV